MTLADRLWQGKRPHGNLGEAPGHWSAPASLGSVTLLATESTVGDGSVPEALAPGTGYWAALAAH